MALNERQKRFVIEYPIDSKGGPAAVRAGYSPNGADQTAFTLLSNPEIAEAIQERQTEIARATALTCEWVLNQWREIASADPDDLISVCIECCRHCYGLNFDYQWTEWEYKDRVRACSEHVCKEGKCEQPCGKKYPPLALGGFGFTPHKSPNPDCPLCHGEGQRRVVLADTKRLRGPARRLYAGVKQTQHGIEVKMRDQDAALKSIAQYLGMVVDKREMAGPNGGPIPIASNITAKDLTDDQLAQFLLQDVE